MEVDIVRSIDIIRSLTREIIETNNWIIPEVLDEFPEFPKVNKSGKFIKYYYTIKLGKSNVDGNIIGFAADGKYVFKFLNKNKVKYIPRDLFESLKV